MIKLSVIICTYNRDEYILETLRHLKEQSCPPEIYEVIIIDNNSSDRTEDLCRDFIRKQDSGIFFYFKETRQGNTYARNRGIRESKGQYISFIDDDAMASTHYCENVIAFFDHNPEVSIIGGKITPVYEKSEPKWMSRFLWPLVAGLDMGDRARPFKKSKYPLGANMAYRSEVFEKYGHFDENIGKRPGRLEGGDEKELIYRIRMKNLKIIYVPGMHVHHVIPDTRLRIDHIRDQAMGVGSSERKRLKGKGFSEWMEKIIDELIKIGGTFVLALIYILTFRREKGIMLIRFRYWVLKGYFKNSK